MVLFNNKFKKITVCIGSLVTIAFSLLHIFLSSSDGALYRVALNATSTLVMIFSWVIIGLCGICVILSLISASMLLGNKKIKILSLINVVLSLVSLIFSIICGGLNLVYIIIQFVFTLLLGVYVTICEIKNKDIEEELTDENKKEVRNSSVFNVIISVISFILLFSIFLIPVCIYDGKTYYSLISGLKDNGSLEYLIAFAAFFILYVLLLVYFANILGTYKNVDKSTKKTRALIIMEFVLAVAFYIYSIVISYFVKNNNSEVTSTFSIGFIPLIVMGLIAIINSIVSGRYINTDDDKKEDKNKGTKLKNRIIALVFVILFLGLLIGSLFSNILVIDYTYSSTTTTVTVNGLDVLKNYQSMETGYQMLAFFIYLIIVFSIIALVVSLSLFFRKSSYFYKFSFVCVIVSFALLLALSLFGKYYEIVKDIQVDTIKDILKDKGLDVSIEYESTVKSQTMYFAIGGLLLFIVLIGLKPFSNKVKDDVLEVSMNGEENKNDDVKQEPLVEENKEEKPKELENETGNNIDFDPCPAFSEIDSYEESYNLNVLERKNKLFENPTLGDIVRFVVDYAKNSRLHLSYQEEDIAQFVAGLGSSRLTILQGMSGTGKTSLPKIFTEALFGNCEIIEVESSWKDKNELIGFYNEFSSRFTPKKFTQALYRAKFMPEVITLIVLDEMNLSRIEYYFSDFLSLMENEEDKREFKILNIQLSVTKEGEVIQYKQLENGHTIKIPTNVWFIGTANRDESTFEISDKVYDRAMTMNFSKRAPKVKDFKNPLDQRFLTYNDFKNLIDQARNSYKFDCENNEIVKEVEKIVAPFNISFGNRILNQIESFVSIYCSCFSNPKKRENEALELILLTKVVQKLETKSIENKEELVHSFEKIGLYRCSEFISKLNEDI